ncbi:MAG: hypothetical protein U9R60_04670 [Bacteroidota bacterium]|nr:hypothetical protein [Bacteroidota bacterium]
MRKLLFKKFLLLIVYTLVYIYFLGFNWKVFTVSLNVNLGFGVVTFPPFIVLFLLGFFIIGALSWVNYMTSLRKIIYELEQGVEVGQVRNQLFRKKMQEQLFDEENINQLIKKMGILDLQKKQEELSLILSELNKKLDETKEGINQPDNSQKDH